MINPLLALCLRCGLAMLAGWMFASAIQEPVGWVALIGYAAGIVLVGCGLSTIAAEERRER